MSKISDLTGGHTPSGNLLRGSDVPEGITQVGFKIEGTRKPPAGFRAAIIFDGKIVEPKEAVEEMSHITAWPASVSQVATIGEIVGNDTEIEDLVGGIIGLSTYDTVNPSTGKAAVGLAAVAFRPNGNEEPTIKKGRR